MTSKVFVAKLEELNNVIAYFEETLESFGAPAKTIAQISVVVEEAFVNVANYAYPNSSGDVKFTLEFNNDNHEFTINMCDNGKPFDPLAKKDPDVTLSGEDRPIGGLGIFMIKTMMDKVSYERIDDKNVLTMTKKI